MVETSLKISVLIITYNQDRYIAQALESAVSQRAREPFEVVVGEDCSTDGTRTILLSHRDRHPEKIRLLLRDRNLGMNRNFAQTLAACRGEYVAILEGDDYWTRPDKLQRQADFLDAHRECAAVFHNVEVVGEGGEPTGRRFHREGGLKPFHSLLDIVSSHFIPTCSTMFRRGLFGEFPEWFYDMPMGDWPLHVLNAQHGLYGYMDEVMACYRVHGKGVWSGRGRVEILEKTSRAAEEINRHLGYVYDASIRKLLADWSKEILYLRAMDRERPDSAQALQEYLRRVSFLGKEYRRAIRKYVKSRFAEK